MNTAPGEGAGGADASRCAAARASVAGARRIVVKIGSAVLTDGASLDTSEVRRLASDVAALVRAGREVVVVSSGAVASGCEGLGLKAMPTSIAQRQAAAAVGQTLLMRAWSSALARRGLVAGQVLLTSEDMHDRVRFLNARRTLEALLVRGIVPIINENDSVAFDEIKLGDNDRLSALVCGLVGAGALVMLSSAPGLLDRGRLVGCVSDLDEVASMVRPEKSAVGTGGMATKLEAARIAGEHGTPTVLVAGSRAGAMVDAANGEDVGTVFAPKRTGERARKRWIRHAARGRGEVRVDAGAAEAIRSRGASLLPRGITGVSGRFEIGAVVDVVGPDGERLGRGVAGYASDEIDRIKGHSTGEIRRVLGYTYCDEVIHRDDLVVLAGKDDAP